MLLAHEAVASPRTSVSTPTCAHLRGPDTASAFRTPYMTSTLRDEGASVQPSSLSPTCVSVSIWTKNKAKRKETHPPHAVSVNTHGTQSEHDTHTNTKTARAPLTHN